MKNGPSGILLSVVASIVASAVIGLAAFYILRGLDSEFKRSARISEIADKVQALQVLTAAFEEDSARSDMRQAKDVIVSLERLLKNLSSREPLEQVLIRQLQRNQRELGPLIDQWFASGRAESDLERERREILGSQVWMKAQFISDDSKRLQDISQRRILEAQGKTGVLIGVLMLLLVVTNGAIYFFSVKRIVKAQEAVRESEKRFRQLADSMPQLVWTANAEGQVDYYNARANEYGVKPTLHTNDDWTPTLHPDDVAPTIQAWQEAVARGVPYQKEQRLRVAEGSYRWHLARAVPQRDENGAVVKWYGTTTDIDDLKRAEEALRESETGLARAQRTAHLGNWKWDVTTDAVTWSEEMFRIFGVDRKGFVPSNAAVQAMMHPEDRILHVELVARALKGEAVAPFECRLVRPNGEERVVLAGGFDVDLDANGRPIHLFGSVLDITERKRAEEAVRDSEAKLRMALDAAQFGTFEFSIPPGEVIWDGQMRRIWGAGDEEKVDYPGLLERVSPEDRERVEQVFAAASRPDSDGDYEVEFRVIWPDGSVHWNSSRGRVHFEGDGPSRRAVRIVGIERDITRQKEFQAELERLVKERTSKLHELVGELEHFSYTITHDLKSPLRAMRGFAELAGEMCDEGEYGRATEFLGRISTAAERMDHLIADALSYSRSVKQELPLEDVDAGALLRSMIDTYPELQPQKATIRLEGQLPVVLANEAGLTQCFSNLLANAVKFVRPGEMPDIRIRAEFLNLHSPSLNPQHPQWVRIWVEDKGIGIGKEMLPRVFDMFARGSKDYEGTGIGLALVRKVAQRMGGRVGVESVEGKGSRFWIELKCGEEKFSRAEACDSAQAAVDKASGDGTVLYVEDEESDAMFMQRAFAENGLSGSLRLVRDGRDAINYLSGSGDYSDREKYPMPKVVLLDLNLPNVPGFEVLQWMRNHPDFSKTPVVIFSSSTREDDRAKARELGANEFVSKPNSAARFGEVVEELRGKWLGVAR